MTKVRECGSCTACCQGWIPGDIHGIRMQPYKPCQYFNKVCTIYLDRPKDPCRNFKCEWLIDNSILPEHMKPSECGAIVIIRDRTMTAMPTGDKVPEELVQELRVILKKNRLPKLTIHRNRKEALNGRDKPETFILKVLRDE